MRKKILLIGGTGAIGMYMIPLLLEQNYEVFVTSRRERTSNHELLHYLQGDGHDISWLEAITNQRAFDFVVDFMIYGYLEFEERYQRLLALGNQYLFLSTYRVFANEDAIIVESSPRKLDVLKKYPHFIYDGYGISKAKQENLLRNSGNVNYSIIRPSMTFSRNRFQYGAADNFDIIRALRHGKSPMSETMLPLATTLTYGKDVAKMMVNLLKNEAIKGQELNVVSGEYHTWQVISEMFNRVFGLEMVPVSNDRYINLTGQWRTMIDRVFPRVFDNSKVLELANMKQSDLFTLEAGLNEAFKESSLDYYRNAHTKWDIHAKFDYFLGGEINLEGISTREKEIYQKSIKSYDEKQPLFSNGIENILLKNDLWHVRTLPWNNQVDLMRVKSHTFGKPQKGENRWISLELGSNLMRGQCYAITFDYLVDENQVIKPFLHNHKKTQIIGEMEPSNGVWKSIELKVTPKYDFMKFLTFTSTDLPVSGKVLSIKNVEVK